jgi:glycosyltransferase involved in cell wall biosynthesis
MRIAILTTDKREHERDYSNPKVTFGTAPEALLQGFAATPEHEIHVISCVQQPMSSPEKLADNIWYHGLLVPKAGWMRTFYQGCIRAVRKKLRELKPDIVHGQGTERDCALNAVFSGYPNVLTIHGNMKAIAELYRASIGSFFWLAGKLETFALSRTGGVFCNSAYTENLVASRAQRIWRVPNAMRAPFFSALPPSRKNDWPVFLNIGVAEPRKRQREILLMARNLWKRRFRFEIHFAGLICPGMVYDDELLKLIAEAEAAGYARHLGALQTDQLVSAMDAADALVHFPTEESFGLVVTEALARNLKLFASSVGGIMETASGVERVELFPANDFTALENSIAGWIAAGCPHPVNAAEIMRQRYSPEIVARRHLEIYREILNKPS